MPRLTLPFVLFLCLVGAGAAAGPSPEALVVIIADQHSAYERTAQLVGRVDRLRREHPGVSREIPIDGDSLEYGTVAARCTPGAIEEETAVVGQSRAVISALHDHP